MKLKQLEPQLIDKEWRMATRINYVISTEETLRGKLIGVIRPPR
ncbi:hypothetical protein [Argonema antarcticum]|nr:hypothetical protein [Argonema antarcticum]